MKSLYSLKESRVDTLFIQIENYIGKCKTLEELREVEQKFKREVLLTEAYMKQVKDEIEMEIENDDD